MKITLFALFAGLLMAGCGEQMQNETKAKAEAKLLGLSDYQGLMDAVNLSFSDEIPNDYTGWISNHGVRVHLTPYKSGKIHGLRTGSTEIFFPAFVSKDVGNANAVFAFQPKVCPSTDFHSKLGYKKSTILISS